MLTSTHTSREIAEAMIDRLLPRYPRSVPVTRPCDRCDGTGHLERQPRGSLCAGTDPGMMTVRCPYCDDGRVDVYCENRGHGVATVVTIDHLGFELGFCDECAKPRQGMEPEEIDLFRILRRYAPVPGVRNDIEAEVRL